MGEDTTDIVADAEKIAEARKERLKTDPQAVRKILSNQVTVSEKVTVYPNKELNLRYEKFNESIVDLGTRVARKDGEDDETYAERIKDAKAEYEAAVAEFDSLKKELAESAVTFELESLSRKAIKALRTAARKKFPTPIAGEQEDPDDSEGREELYKASIIAAHLVKDGYTVEDIEKIRDEWPTRCYVQLWQSANKLSIADDYLGAAFTPDF